MSQKEPRGARRCHCVIYYHHTRTKSGEDPSQEQQSGACIYNTMSVCVCNQLATFRTSRRRIISGSSTRVCCVVQARISHHFICSHVSATAVLLLHITNTTSQRLHAAWLVMTKPNPISAPRDYPPNLSISVSGGKETNEDSPSNGE